MSQGLSQQIREATHVLRAAYFVFSGSRLHDWKHYPFSARGILKPGEIPIADDGRDIPVLAMGPIGITPDLKRKGYGKKLLDYSLEKAAELGFGAVLFEGNIDFYGKSGFDYGRNFGIRYHDLPEGADDSFFLCKELIPGYLDGITGVYQTPKGYYVDDADVEEFDKAFPPKEKLKLPGQIF